MKIKLLPSLFPILLSFLTLNTYGDERGDEIIGKSIDRRRVKGIVERVSMTLIDRRGGERKRELIIKSKEENNLLKSYAMILEPPDLEGTKFLMIENEGRRDDQFLYLPSLKKVRRISARSRQESFMGSDFSYEDMEIGKVEETINTYLRDEVITIEGEKIPCYLVESVPVKERAKESQYSKARVWASKEDYTPRRVDLYNLKGEEFKRLLVEKVKREGNIYILQKMTMENLIKGSKTILVVKDYSIGKEHIPDEIFTPSYLEREE